MRIIELIILLLLFLFSSCMSTKEKSNYALDGCYDMIKQKKFTEAVNCCNYVIELEPNNAIAYNDRGYSYYKLGKLAEAVSDFSKSIIIKSNYIEAYKNRGYAFFDQARYEDAISDWENAIQMDNTLERELRAKIDEAKKKLSK